MISCCLTGYDGDPCDLYDARTVTARKAYRCCECGDPIRPGERYERARWLFDGSWGTEATCSTCVTIRNDHDCGEGWTHGDLYEQLADCYGYGVVNGDDDDDELDPMGPPPVEQQRHDGRYGCCVAGDCDGETCVRLPPGATCWSCLGFESCRHLGARIADTGCQWFPRRYRPAPERWMEQRRRHHG